MFLIPGQRHHYLDADTLDYFKSEDVDVPQHVTAVVSFLTFNCFFTFFHVFISNSFKLTLLYLFVHLPALYLLSLPLLVPNSSLQFLSVCKSFSLLSPLSSFHFFCLSCLSVSLSLPFCLSACLFIFLSSSYLNLSLTFYFSLFLYFSLSLSILHYLSLFVTLSVFPPSSSLILSLYVFMTFCSPSPFYILPSDNLTVTQTDFFTSTNFFCLK